MKRNLHGSPLLQKIYQMLWQEDHLTLCFDGEGKVIKGDTMNSTWIMLNSVYKFLIETEEQKEERLRLRQRYVHKKYILSRYAENPEGVTRKLDEIKGLRDFLSCSHTLGNFIPVPNGCNGPRGMRSVKDYWDLTLKVIYDYYKGNEDRIEGMVGKNKEGVYKKWLATFSGENGQGRWNCFVERNYMQAFVKEKDENGNYGGPKELWTGHFNGSVCLRWDRKRENARGQVRKQAEEYFTNASKWIILRSQRMIEEL